MHCSTFLAKKEKKKDDGNHNHKTTMRHSQPTKMTATTTTTTMVEICSRCVFVVLFYAIYGKSCVDIDDFAPKPQVE